MRVSCCSDNSTAELELAVGCRRLNPSNCSRPPSIGSARAESCTCFDPEQHPCVSLAGAELVDAGTLVRDEQFS